MSINDFGRLLANRRVQGDGGWGGPWLPGKSHQFSIGHTVYTSSNMVGIFMDFLLSCWFLFGGVTYGDETLVIDIKKKVPKRDWFLGFYTCVCFKPRPRCIVVKILVPAMKGFFPQSPQQSPPCWYTSIAATPRLGFLLTWKTWRKVWFLFRQLDFSGFGTGTSWFANFHKQLLVQVVQVVAPKKSVLKH